MAYDFGALPPEIISGWMYGGAGPGPLMAAGSAWSNLGAELESAATAIQSVVYELTGAYWQGPASTSMTAAVTPYLGWLNSTAAAAMHAAAQATASAGAFQAAHAATVPPPVIAANRALLATLVASNILGQNTPAILATEAHYMEMWAQDTLAMFGYSASSASAGTLTPMTQAPPVANSAGSLAQGMALAETGASSAGGLQQELGQALTTLQGAVQSLATPLTSSSSPISGIADGIDRLLGTPLFSNAINGGVNTAAWFVMNTIPTAVSLGHTLANAPAAAVAAEAVGAEGLATGLAGSVAPAGAVGLGAGPVATATLAQASSVGGLSVPATWSAAAPAASVEATTLTGTGWTAAAEEAPGVEAVPAGMPSAAAAGRGGFGFGAPRYGIRPTVMPKKLLV
ncbi:PPE family protein [Mycobacterium sp. pUA109]|uniref:PPE family protein n=1 Tax=Mycobacterium sp. pUA109 TaxID=3238982 RepID=UPI00351AF49E